MKQASIKRDMKLSDLNISNAKYNELKYFCMQYKEKRQELRNSYGVGSFVSNGMPRGNTISNPTESRAIRNIKLQEDIRLIEKTAEEADAEIYRYILKSVTEGLSYEYMGDVPRCRTKFYDSRRYFFYLLAQKR